MFGGVFGSHRLYTIVVRTSKSLLPRLCRILLTVVLHPITFSVTAFWGLYSSANYVFTTQYFTVFDWIWTPAFPLSYRVVFLLLFVIPTFSFLHVVRLGVQSFLLVRHGGWRSRLGWLSPSSRGYFPLERSDSNLMEERGLLSAGMRARNEEGYDMEFDERSARVDPTPYRPSALFSLLQFAFWFFVFCVSLWYVLHYQHPGDVRYLSLVEKANARPDRAGYGKQEKIFIAAMFSNNEHVIPYWSDSLVKAIHYLGEDNVFVSILESESWDQSPALLEQLDDRLAAMNVARRILVRDSAFPKPQDMGGNHRIDFLSALRNRVLEPLVENGGYDKVLFSNDIYIEAESIIELVETANGDYDMVCGMDFGQWGAYDMWVLRDKLGRLASGIWPYFSDYDAYEALKAESPVPVFSCWNGIVVFQADPILPIHLRSNRTLSEDPLPFELPHTHPATRDPSLRGPSPALTPPMRFRAGIWGECFSSECFLLPYDFRRLFNMQRIYLNPRVVVAYDWRFYLYFKWWIRHPVVKWWIEKVYHGAWMNQAVYVVGDNRRVWNWDGGDCFPW